jgi:hypothetical protein
VEQSPTPHPMSGHAARCDTAQPGTFPGGVEGLQYILLRPNPSLSSQRPLPVPVFISADQTP